ncbi:MAG: oxidoreductase [Candidatus Binatus sp.]|uniref:oxidoreductase n=1 Tax=Candidatus Binatus sp. TaxID=2811406 RepID=UPI002717977B|nr:oxidoreductase [Candidatus Binatus sp.]MDO8431571.1 oxidoreductase [Candidatus Binatus sp.]
MPNSNRWTADDLPDLSGKVIIVTGGNSGIGYEAALQFARKRARVVLGCRDLGKARAAVEQIKAASPDASIDSMQLDLANLASVRGFADAFHLQHRALDVLCNNAGVMALPYRQTADGFEMQFGTNHLGHFALTGLLLDLILATENSRVVNVSSGMHRLGRIRFDDLQWKTGYRKWFAYGQSKLANLLFTFELQRRLEAAGSKTISVACHPGYAATNLQAAGPKMQGSSLMESLVGVGNRLFSQSAAMGALPTLYAAASSDARGGDYIGPDGFSEMWGAPTKVECTAAARDTATAARLWQVSEDLAKVRFDFSARSQPGATA